MIIIGASDKNRAKLSERLAAVKLTKGNIFTVWEVIEDILKEWKQIIAVGGLLITIMGVRLFDITIFKEIPSLKKFFSSRRVKTAQETQAPPSQITREKDSQPVKNIIAAGMAVLGAVSSILSLSFMISPILDSQSLTSDVAIKTGMGERPLNNIENETEPGTPLKNLSPINKANKELEARSPPQETAAAEARKIEFARLIEILKDLASSSTKLSFIRDNLDLMPDSLSLVELHHILALFSSSNNKLAVIQIFLSRLPDSLSLGELNFLLDQFSSTDKKFRVTTLFLSRLEDEYSDSDFEGFRKHYTATTDKKKAIELLLRKGQHNNRDKAQ